MKKWLSIGFVAVLVGIVVMNNIPKKEEMDASTEQEQNSGLEREEVVGNGESEQDTTTDESEQSKLPQLSDRAVRDFKLPTILGEESALYDYLGKPVVLVFWATWCGPCNEELPKVQKYYETNKDVQIITINALDTERNVETVAKHVASNGWTFPVLVDETGEVRQSFGAFSVPMTVFLSADGAIAHEVYGPIDEAYIDDIISKM